MQKHSVVLEIKSTWSGASDRQRSSLRWAESFEQRHTKGKEWGISRCEEGQEAEAASTFCCFRGREVQHRLQRAWGQQVKGDVVSCQVLVHTDMLKR